MRAFVFAAVLASACPLLSQPATAFDMPEDEAEAQFVTSNVLAAFYHELGHALIDVLQLPVLGKEEDAADTLSALLVHDIWDESSATQIIYDTASSYAMYAAEAKAQGYEPAFSDEHSLDLQRYYNLICLFYGADPNAREDVAKELELPPERAERCPDEFEQAQASWGGLLSGLEPGADAKGLRMADADPNDPIAQLLQTEVDDLNKTYGLPEWIGVTIAPCGEANAYYSPDDKTITMCSEYAEDAARIWEASAE